MQNLSYENEFDVREKEPVGGTHFHISGLVLTQAKVNSKMAYCTLDGEIMHFVSINRVLLSL